MILAGDIGGTKTVLALFECESGRLRRIRDATFPSAEHGTLEAIIDAFFDGSSVRAVEAACFGIAGAVHAGTVRTTNLPWYVEERSLATACGARHVRIINDLQAAAYGMLALQPEEFVVLQSGTREASGNVAVIAPGTGLGEAMLYWDESRYHPIGSEGGHADFAPRTSQEIQLLQYLQHRFGHVSYERVLSGDGIHNLYSFLRDTGGTPEPPWLTQRIAEEDPNAVIAETGLAEKDPICVATLDLFASILGAEAGNLALKLLATGGVFIGGGIVTRIRSVFERENFIRAFTDKGRFSDWMRAIPVRAAMNREAPLLGAARYLVDHVYRTE